jgi:hypothetical protein
VDRDKREEAGASAPADEDLFVIQPFQVAFDRGPRLREEVRDFPLPSSAETTSEPNLPLWNVSI